MRPLSTIADRAMGYLGLFLIGAISWAADRRGSTGPEPGIPTRMVPRRGVVPKGAAHPGVPFTTTPRAAG